MLLNRREKKILTPWAIFGQLRAMRISSLLFGACSRFQTVRESKVDFTCTFRSCKKRGRNQHGVAEIRKFPSLAHSTPMELTSDTKYSGTSSSSTSPTYPSGTRMSFPFRLRPRKDTADSVQGDRKTPGSLGLKVSVPPFHPTHKHD